MSLGVEQPLLDDREDVVEVVHPDNVRPTPAPRPIPVEVVLAGLGAIIGCLLGEALDNRTLLAHDMATTLTVVGGLIGLAWMPLAGRWTPRASGEVAGSGGRAPATQAAAAHRQAAWRIYVDLCARVSLAPAPEDPQILLALLQSLHKLRKNAREELKLLSLEPALPLPHLNEAPTPSADSVIAIGLDLLRGPLKDLIFNWEPRLEAWLTLHPGGVPWEPLAACQQDLQLTREQLLGLAARLRLLLALDAGPLMPTAEHSVETLT